MSVTIGSAADCLDEDHDAHCLLPIWLVDVNRQWEAMPLHHCRADASFPVLRTSASGPMVHSMKVEERHRWDSRAAEGRKQGVLPLSAVVGPHGPYGHREQRVHYAAFPPRASTHGEAVAPNAHCQRSSGASDLAPASSPTPGMRASTSLERPKEYFSLLPASRHHLCSCGVCCCCCYCCHHRRHRHPCGLVRTFSSHEAHTPACRCFAFAASQSQRPTACCFSLRKGEPRKRPTVAHVLKVVTGQRQ